MRGLLLPRPPIAPSGQTMAPHPTPGLLDFYVLGPLSKVLQPQYGVEDFTLRDRLGSGNYGQGERHGQLRPHELVEVAGWHGRGSSNGCF